MSSGADDLEDGEIFDDDEPVEVFKGGGPEKPPNLESPPKDIFKNKNVFGGDKKKNNKDKRNSSNDRREKRNERNTGGGKRKRGRESEEDHRPPTKNKQRKTTNEKSKGKEQSVDEEIDENEMVYVMGGNSPTAARHMDWDNNSVYSDEEEGVGEREKERGGRGRRGREGFQSQGRMSRRARLGRGAGGAGNTKRRFNNNRKQNNEQAICKFFLQGKCQRIRGNDCPYSHGTVPTKKMELCKFYMNDCCTKRDKCMYMHGDFPCKFYHTGQKCYAGKRCKFYHGKISNFLRSVLMKHLENRELQNEFERYREEFEKKESSSRGRDRFASRSDNEEEGGSTPMPSPQREETSDRERSPTPEREREKRERRRRRMLRRSREQQQGGRKQQQQQREQQPYDNKEELYDNQQDNEYNQWNDNDNQYYSNEDNYNDNYNDNQYSENYEEAVVAEESEVVANLPKTQRNLFMRIQNQNNKSQQRQRKEDESREEDYKEDNWYSSDEDGASALGANASPLGASANPLSTIFQSVPGLTMQPVPLMSQPIPPPMMQQPFPQQPPVMMNPLMSQPPPNILQPPTSVPNVNMFDNIDLSAVTKILSTVRESIQKKNTDSTSVGQSCMGANTFGGNAGGMMGPGINLATLMSVPPPAINQPRVKQQPSSSPQHNPQPEERRLRDPRLRGQEGSEKKGVVKQLPPVLPPILLTQADLDLRLSEPSPQTSSPLESDIDLRALPFKPAPLHQAAREIDASLHSGPPVEWTLQLLAPFRPDYPAIAARASPQMCANDPRLRKYATPQVLAQSQMVMALPSSARMTSPPTQSPPQTLSNPIRPEEVVVSRDPRNRGGVANDPRRRNVSTAQYGAQARGPGAHELQDNDFRLGFPSQLPHQSSFSLPNMADVDLRVQQPHFYQ